jgi:hypothetical protein
VQEKKSWKKYLKILKMMFENDALKRSISKHGRKPSLNFVFSTFKQNLISQFFDLVIENPIGGGTLAKFRSSLYWPTCDTDGDSLCFRELMSHMLRHEARRTITSQYLTDLTVYWGRFPGNCFPQLGPQLFVIMGEAVTSSSRSSHILVRWWSAQRSDYRSRQAARKHW